jgi:hypothetical protein
LFIVIGVISVQKNQQTIYSAWGLTATNIVGMILLLVIPVTRVKLLVFCMAGSYYSVYVLLVTSISNNMTGYQENLLYNGALMVFYTLGNFIRPFMMVEPPYICEYVGLFDC